MKEIIKNKSSRILFLVMSLILALGINNGSNVKAAGGENAPSYGQISAVKFTKVVNGYLGGSALDAAGSVWSWGYNAYGQTGVDKYADGTELAVTNARNGYLGGMRRVEFFVENNIKVTQISGGYQTRIALDNKGNVYTWGRGAYGEMGNGTTSNNNRTPLKVNGLPAIKEILSSNGETMTNCFAIDFDGRIWAWGYNAFGQLGIGRTATSVTTPEVINVPTTFTKIAAGGNHTVALDTNGDIWVTGYAYRGRLGNGGSTGNLTSFTKMNKPSGMGKITAISAAFGMNAVINTAGEVWQWGEIYGRGGYQAHVDAVETPEKLVTKQSEIASIGYTPIAKKIIAGESVSYYIDQFGRTWAWGDNRYHAFGRDGGWYNSNQNATHRISQAEQWPKVMGDGDTAYMNDNNRKPSYLNVNQTTPGVLRNSRGGYGLPAEIYGLHPTVYDEKYMARDSAGYILNAAGKRVKYKSTSRSATADGTELGFYYLLDSSNNLTSTKSVPAVAKKEKPWIDLAGKNLPYIEQMDIGRSAFAMLDKDGNIYKWALDGSGTIAWGWDVEEGTETSNPKGYDYYPSNDIRNGLYDRYVYEVVYMRGAPVVDPVVLNTTATKEKIYDTSTNTKTIDVSVSAKLPESFVSKEMGITIKSELQEVKYVVIPYDKTNPDFNIANKDLTQEEFLKLYAKSAYKKGSLIDAPIDGGDTGKTWNGKINVEQNSRVIVMSVDLAYTKTSTIFSDFLVDYFYTPVVVKHNGMGDLENTKFEEIYKATEENVTKKLVAPDTNTAYGLPLDANNKLIVNPSYGYDQVDINKYTTLPDGNDKYWLFKTPQAASTNLVLNDVKYLDGHLHTFDYVKNPLGWMEISYRGVVFNGYADLAGFTIDADNPESIKKDIEIVRHPSLTIDEYSIIGYRIGMDPEIHYLNAADEFRYTALSTTRAVGEPTDKVKITFLYGTSNLTANKKVLDENKDGKASPKEKLSYTITASNIGDASAKQTTIKDTLSTLTPYIVNGTNTSLINVTVASNKDSAKNEIVTLDKLIAGMNYDLVAGENITLTFDVYVISNLNTKETTSLANKVTVGDKDATVTITTGTPLVTGKKVVTDTNGDKKASPSETLNYALTAENKGDAKATSVIIKDTLTNVLGHVEDGDKTDDIIVTITSNKDVAKNKTDKLSNLIKGYTFDLVTDELVTITFSVKLKSTFDTTKVTEIANTATIDGKDTTAKIETGTPKIDGKKAVTDKNTDGFASPTEELKYVITATNNGTATANDVLIKDTLSSLLDHIDDGKNPNKINVTIKSTDTTKNQIVTLDKLIAGLKFDMVAKEVITLEFIVVVIKDLDVTDVTSLLNTATIGGNTVEKEIETGKPGLGGTKNVVDANKDGYAAPNEALAYTLTATNTGKAKANDVVVKDPLTDLIKHLKTSTNPSTIALDISSNKDSAKNQKTTLDKLVSGLTYDIITDEVITFKFTVILKEDLDANTIKNIANTFTINEEKITKSIPTGQSIITTLKDVTDENNDTKAAPGELLNYKITVSNSGTGINNAVNVKDDLVDVLDHVDDGSNPQSINVLVKYASDAALTTSITLDKLIAGANYKLIANEVITFEFSVRVKKDLDTNAVQNIANTVTVDGNNTTEIIPTGKPKIDGTKNVVDANGDKKAAPGEALTYTITAKNNGNATSKDTIIKDELKTVLPHIIGGKNPEKISIDITSDKDPLKNERTTLDKLITGLKYNLVKDELITVIFSVTLDTELKINEVLSIDNTVLVGETPIIKTIPTGKANIEASKNVTDSNDDGLASSEEVLNYTISAKNSGSATANDVEIKDTLSTLSSYIKEKDTLNDVNVVISSTNSINSKTVKLTDLITGIKLNLIANEELTLTFKVTVMKDINVSTTPVLANTATIGDVPVTKTINTGKPGIGGKKVVTDEDEDKKAAPGEELKYVITAANTGTVKATKVSIKDTLSAMLKYVDNGDNPSAISMTIASDKDSTKNQTSSLDKLISGLEYDIDANETITITFMVTVLTSLDTSVVKVIGNTVNIGDNVISETINTKQYGTLLVIKFDETNAQNTLPNAVFKLEDLSGKLIKDEIKTSVTGRVVVPRLEVGEYNLIETSAPANYLLDRQPRKVRIVNNSITTIRVANEKASRSNFFAKTASQVSNSGAIKVVAVDAQDDNKLLKDQSFTLLDANKNNVKESKTNDKGVAEFKDLTPAKYTLVHSDGVTKSNVEVKANGESISRVMVDSQSNKITQSNDIAKTLTKQTISTRAGDVGVLMIAKYYINDLGLTMMLEDAEFEIWNTDTNTLYQTVTSDFLGEVYIENMPVGNYKLVETKAPLGFVAVTGQKDENFVIEKNMLTISEIINKEDKVVTEGGSAILTKRDKHNQNPMPGVVFDLLDTNKVVVKSGLVTDANGEIELLDLAPGRYFWQETKALDEYIATGVLLDFTVNAGIETLYYTENALKRSVVTIQKKDTDTGAALAGAQFKIYGTIFGVDRQHTVTTNASGIATINNVMPGTYTVEELVAPYGYEILKDTLTLVVNKGGDSKNATFVVNNTRDIDLSGTKTVTDTNQDNIASPKEELTYVITATNGGTSKAFDVSIKDTLSSMVDYIDKGDTPNLINMTIASNKDATKNEATTLDKLIAGLEYDLVSLETITITFKVTVLEDLDTKKVTEIANTVTIGDTPVVETIDTGKPVFDVKKAVTDENDDKKAAPGEKLSYVISATNTGDATATDVEIKDTLLTVLPHLKKPVNPSSINVKVTYLSDATKETTVTLDKLIAGLKFDLIENEKITLSFEVTLANDLDTDTVKNIANTVTVGEEPTTETIPTGEEIISGTKAVTDQNNDNKASSNEKLSYTITASNTGDATSKDTPIKDTLATLVDYVKLGKTPDKIAVTITSNKNAARNITSSLDKLIAGYTYDLEAGETITITFDVYVIDNLDTDTVKVLSNTATIGKEPVTETIDTGKTDLDVKKEATDTNGDGFASPDEVLNYAITIENKGDAKATDVVIQDTLSTMKSSIKEDGKLDTVNVNVTYKNDPTKDTTKTLAQLVAGFKLDIPAGEIVTLSFEVTVITGLDVDTVDEIANTVVVDEKPTTETITTGKPGVGGTKTVTDTNSDTKASPGEELTYVITATNTGTAKANKVSIQDTLSSMVDYIDKGDKPNLISMTIASNKDATKNEVTTLDKLIAGLEYDIDAKETITITFNVTVLEDLDTKKVTEIANTVTIGDTPVVETIDTGKPVFDVKKAVTDENDDKKAAPGEKLSYVISATNTGDATATDVEIKDTLLTVLPHLKKPVNPSSINVKVTYLSDATKETTVTLDKLIAGLKFDLIENEKITLSFEVTLANDLDTDTVKNIANTVTVGEEPTTETIPTGEEIISGTKAVTDQNDDNKASSNEKLSYTLTASNTGDATSKDTPIKDTLTTLVDYIKLGKTPDKIAVTITSNKNAARNITSSLDKLIAGYTYDLEAGETITITFDVYVIDNLDTDTVKVLSNTATIGKEPVTETIDTGKTDLDVKKEATDTNGDGFASPDEVLNYAITIENKGDAKATDVVIQDTLSTMKSSIKEDGKLDTVNVNVTYKNDPTKDTTKTLAQLVAGFKLDIPAGEIVTLSFEVTVITGLDVDTVDEIANTVVVDEKPTTETITTGKPGVGGTKTVTDTNNDTKASPGEELTYVITATNTGTAKANDVSIQDTLSSMVDYIDKGDKPNLISMTIASNKDATKNEVTTLDKLIAGLEYDIDAKETITITFKVKVKADLDTDTIKIIKNVVTINKTEIEAKIDTAKTDVTAQKYVSDKDLDGRAEPKEELSYKIIASNNGKATANDIMIKDDLVNVLPHIEDGNNPEKISVLITSSNDSSKNQTVTLDKLIAGIKYDMIADEIITFEFNVVLDKDLDTDAVKNIANTVIVGETDKTIIIPTGKPIVSGKKTVVDANNDEKAVAKEKLSYTITASNTGTSTSDAIEIKDTMSTVTPYIKSGQNPENIAITITSNKDVSRNITSSLDKLIAGYSYKLIAGEVITITFDVYVIDELDTDSVQQIENTVLIGGEDIIEIIETGKVDLDVKKEATDTNGDGFASPDEVLNYAITIENKGDAKATDVVIQDTLSTMKSSIKEDGKLDTVNVNVTYKNDPTKDTTKTLAQLVAGFKLDIPAGEIVTLSFEVTVITGLDVDTVDEIANTVVVDEKPTTETITTGKPGVGGTKTVTDKNKDGKASPKEELTYVITATNTGTAKANDVSIKDTLISMLDHIDNGDKPNLISMTIKSSSDASKNATSTLDKLIAGLEYDIDAKEVITITFKVTVLEDLDTKKVTMIANTVTIGDTPVVEEIDTGKPVFDVKKDVTDENDDKKAAPGEKLSYVISATNTGDATATDVEIKDTLLTVLPHLKKPVNPSSINVKVTYLSDATKETTVTLDKLIAGLKFDLIENEKITLSFEVTLADDLDTSKVLEIANTVTVGGEPTTETIPTGKPYIAGTKNVTDASDDQVASPKEELTYILTAKNTGTATSKETVIKDTLVNVLSHITDKDNTDTVDVIISSDKDNTKNRTTNLDELIDGIKVNIGVNETISVTFKVTLIDNLNVDSIKNIANKAVIGGVEVTETIPTGISGITGKKEVTDANTNEFAEPNEVLNYKISATNSGTAGSKDVEIKDTLSTLLTHIKEADTDSIVVNISSNKDNTKNRKTNATELIAGISFDFIANETIEITFSVTVKADLNLTVVTEMSNTVSIGEETETATIKTGKANVVASKSVQDTNLDKKASPGEILTYTITAENTGNIKAVGVEIQDALTNLIKYIENAQTPEKISVLVKFEKDPTKNKTVKLSELIAGLTTDIDAKEKVSLSFNVQLLETLDVDSITQAINIAIVGDKKPEAEIKTGDANIVASKSVKDTNDDMIASPSEKLYYTLTAENTGDATEDSVIIKDTLANIKAYIKNGNTPANIAVKVTSNKDSAKNITVTLADLMNGFDFEMVESEKITIEFTVEVNDDLDVTKVKTLANQATIGAEKPTVTLPTGKPGVGGKKEVEDKNKNGYAELNEELKYKISVTNAGTALAEDVIIKDTLETLIPHIKEGANPSSIVVNVTSNKDASKTATLTGADLIAGLTYDLVGNETVTVEFVVNVKTTLDLDVVTSLKNIATIGETPVEKIIPIGKPIISGNKVVQDANPNGFAEPNEKLTYTITGTNSGTVAAKDVEFKDLLDNVLPHVKDGLTPDNLVVKVKSNKNSALNDTLTATDLINGIKYDIGVNETISVILEVYVNADLDINTTTQLVNTATIGGIEKEVKIPTAELRSVHGIVFEDLDYNSLYDDNKVIANHPVQLMDNATNKVVASTVSDVNGVYKFEKLISNKITKINTEYYIKAGKKTGYMVSNKGNNTPTESTIDIDTYRSDKMMINQKQVSNYNIGLAKDIVVSVAPNYHEMKVSDKVKSNINLNYGTNEGSSLDNSNISYDVNGEIVNITGLKVGTSRITLSFKDLYQRKTITKTIDVKIAAKAKEPDAPKPDPIKDMPDSGTNAQVALYSIAALMALSTGAYYYKRRA